MRALRVIVCLRVAPKFSAEAVLPSDTTHRRRRDACGASLSPCLGVHAAVIAVSRLLYSCTESQGRSRCVRSDIHALHVKIPAVPDKLGRQSARNGEERKVSVKVSLWTGTTVALSSDAVPRSNPAALYTTLPVPSTRCRKRMATALHRRPSTPLEGRWSLS